MNETTVLALSTENKCRRRPASGLASHTTHIQTLCLHLIQEQSTKGIIPDTAGYGNILSEATKSNCRVQGVAAGKDSDFITQDKFAGLWKSC
jgi:hypothetical protein